MKTIVFDLDDTICFPNHDRKDTYGRYALAKPNIPVIEGIRILHQSDYHIIIHSARRMLTHNGDVQKIIEDVGDVTVKWLIRNDVPYNELIFGKPYADTYYVDDKAMTVETFIKRISRHNNLPWYKRIFRYC